jgi:hypothetical protein
MANSIALGLTRSSLEPTIYPTQGELSNHYTTETSKKGQAHVVTCGAGTSRSSGAPEFIPCFLAGFLMVDFSFLCNVL